MDKQILEDLIKKGYTKRQIGDEVGIGQTAVRYWLIKHGLETVKKFECNKCKTTDKTLFSPGRFTVCKKCRGRHQTKSYRGHKKKSVEYKGGKCEKCGYKKCLAALDFHHRDPKKKDPRWKYMKNWSFEKVKNELDKCMLVCKNCHAEIHHGEDQEFHLTQKIIKKKYKCIYCAKNLKGKRKFCDKCLAKRIKEDNINGRKVEWPNKKELAKLLWKKPATQIAKEFGVSDSAIVKWAKKYGLKKPPRGYWTKVKNK